LCPSLSIDKQPGQPKGKEDGGNSQQKIYGIHIPSVQLVWYMANTRHIDFKILKNIGLLL
jgi:hypothetical protein